MEKAGSSIAEIGKSFSSWWYTLDNPTDGGAKASSSTQSETDHDGILQKLFNLPHGESLLESFPCKLVQTYSCSHNKYTPDIQVLKGT